MRRVAGVVDRVAFAVLRSLVLGLARLLFGFRAEGRVPSRGALILAANHTSLLDAFLVGLAARRRVRFLMTENFAGLRGARWFFRWQGVIFVRESRSNLSMLRAALGALAGGDAVGIFPEGGISRDGRMLPMQPGVVALAERSGAPIVPVVIDGSFRALPRWARWPRPSTILVRIGEPIVASDLLPADLARGAGLDVAAERLGARMLALQTALRAH
jgi:1-acyl-sn-glycerol-3-phosphate acyltransferase